MAFLSRCWRAAGQLSLLDWLLVMGGSSLAGVIASTYAFIRGLPIELSGLIAFTCVALLLMAWQIKRRVEAQDAPNPDFKAVLKHKAYLNRLAMTGRPSPSPQKSMASEVKANILAKEDFSLGFNQTGFTQIHKAVRHIAKYIGDSDQDSCFPSTLVVLRQKAADGDLRIRGRKQLDVSGGIRFSGVHTEIPKAYWANSTIGVLATSDTSTEDIHTNPETFNACGARGVDEPNRYADLRVEWADILRLWPR